MLDFHESRELVEATTRYVARLKLVYTALDERDLYETVYEISSRRMEEAREANGNR